MHSLHKEAHTHKRSESLLLQNTQDRLTWSSITPTCSRTSYFSQLLSLPLSISSLSYLSPSSPLLHFSSDRGSGFCADCGWLEHCAVHWGSRNLSPCTLNVPLEQQFLWGEIMRWWACVKGSWGGGSVRVGRRGEKRGVVTGETAHYCKKKLGHSGGWVGCGGCHIL